MLFRTGYTIQVWRYQRENQKP